MSGPFIEVLNGGWINIAHVVSARPDGGLWKITTSDGETHTAHEWAFDPEKHEPAIPAAPGFEVLSYWPQDDGRGIVDRQPVVAWRPQPHGATPVTLDDRPEIWPIRYPDGQVVVPFVRGWANEAEWIAAKAPPAEDDLLA